MSDPLDQVDIEAMILEMQRQLDRVGRGPTIVGAAAENERAIGLTMRTMAVAGEITEIRFRSHRRLLGPFLVMAAEIVRQLLWPFLEGQTRFNRAARDAAMLLDRRIEHLAARLGNRDGGGEERAPKEDLDLGLVEEVRRLRERVTALEARQDQQDQNPGPGCPDERTGAADPSPGTPGLDGQARPGRSR